MDMTVQDLRLWLEAAVNEAAEEMKIKARLTAAAVSQLQAR